MNRYTGYVVKDSLGVEKKNVGKLKYLLAERVNGYVSFSFLIEHLL